MIVTTAVTIRQLLWQTDDIRQLLEIERASFNRYDAYSVEDFERWCHYNPDLCQAAELDGRMAGYLLARLLPGFCDLGSLAIAPAYRRAGVGRALLAELEQRLNAAGVPEIQLEVRTSNRSGLAFWRQMGFVPFGTLPAFYQDGEDAVRMRKELEISRPEWLRPE